MAVLKKIAQYWIPSLLKHLPSFVETFGAPVESMIKIPFFRRWSELPRSEEKVRKLGARTELSPSTDRSWQDKCRKSPWEGWTDKGGQPEGFRELPPGCRTKLPELYQEGLLLFMFHGIRSGGTSWPACYHPPRCQAKGWLLPWRENLWKHIEEFYLWKLWST